jgi:hypothetical protein
MIQPQVPPLAQLNSLSALRFGCGTKFFKWVECACFMAKAELAFRTPRRFALRARGRQAALECVRASAAFQGRSEVWTWSGGVME